ncbi:MAG TPA: ABC transporter ATP-binding protein [Pilimelia sp.]|nr:ABC transporter ATP-binding protein [Pilimelia sp.]
MIRILRLALLSAGSFRAQLRSCLWATALAALAQTVAYLALIPLLAALTRDPVDTAAAWRWCAVFAAAYAVESALRLHELRFQYTHWASVLAELRLRLGDQLRRMPLRELERRAAGDLSTVVGGNAANASMGVSTLSLLFLQLVTVPAILGAVIIAVDWRLGLVLAAATPVAVAFVRRMQRVSGAGFRRLDAADARAADHVIEYVQGLPVWKATGQLGPSAHRLVGALERQGEEMGRMQRRLTMPGILAASTVQVCLVAMVAVGAALALAGSLSLPLLLGLTAAAVRMAEPLATAAAMTGVFELTDAALERVGDVLAVPPLPVDGRDRRITRFDLSFEEVTFGYDPAAPVLRGLTLTAPERRLTALVGHSGCGKTTVTRLLTRYADPDAGAVRIGGEDLRGLDPAEIHRHVSVVFQDVYLFDDTVRANIAMGRPDATAAQVEAAARAANAHDFITALPAGYDTPVGEIGGRLSGGERQRISLARAILKDAPIVLLDEPTAALDTESEVAVQRAIDALVADRTVLVIAHRLSTLVSADRILVLHDGAVAEQGRHEELLAAGGRYAAMWAAQHQARHWRVPAPTGVPG